MGSNREQSARGAVPPVREVVSRIGSCVLLSFVAVLSPGCGASPDEGSASVSVPSRPSHILLISLDALRADHLGCYGYDRPTSPFLDEFATRGTLFSHASVNTHGTPPSHTTMLSSLYQETHRVGFGAGTPEGRNDTIPAEVELVPEILGRNGWHTVAVTGGGYMSATFGFSRGFEDFSDRARSVDQGTTMLLEKIERAMIDGRPVFAMYHTYEIHSPYEPPQEYRSLFGEFQSDIPPKSEALVPLQVRASKVLKREDFDFLESQYDGEIRYTDVVLRRFFRRLSEIGFLENALIIVTADHGEEFGDHGGLLHRGTLYEELVHIPLILVGPDVPGGIIDPRLVSLIDIAPTILDAAGLPKTPIMEGRSLLNRPPVADWSAQRAFAQYTDRLYSVRTPRWKLILKTHSGRFELFDLRRDPAERLNVVKRYPEIGDVLGAELDTWRKGLLRLNIPENRPHRVSPELIDELKALGYVE